MGFWGTFYASAVFLTLIHSMVPIMPKRLRHHTVGAEIITLTWIGSLLSREITGDLTPLEAFAAIDVAAAGAFLWVAVAKKAIWAAVCVVIHAAMSALHLAQKIAQVSDYSYLVILNGLFLASLIVINVAIVVARHSWGRHVDQFFMAVSGGWNWSGAREHRNPRYPSGA